jgi:hypothetical protein
VAIGTEAATPARPGVRAALRRSRSLKVAALAWLLLIVLLAALDDAAGRVPGWFAWGVATLLLPAVGLFALAALPLLAFAPLRRAGIALGATLAALVALLWALVAGVGAWLSGGPYELIFWLDADSAAGLARRHPDLTVSLLGADTTVRDAAGRRVELDLADVTAERFAFEDCGAPPTTERLGGLPPPALPCRFRYRLSRDGHERLVHVYERERVNRADWTTLPGGAPLPYADWGRARGAEVQTGSGGGGQRSVSDLTLRQDGRIWQVRTIRTQFRHRVLIAEGGGPLHLPAPWEEGAAPPPGAASRP